MGHHAMLGDPGKHAVVSLIGESRLVSFTIYSIKTLEVAFVGRHFGGGLSALDEGWCQVSTGKRVKGVVMFLLRSLGEGAASHICMAPTPHRLNEKLKW